jgi:hypothetical protein
VTWYTSQQRYPPHAHIRANAHTLHTPLSKRSSAWAPLGPRAVPVKGPLRVFPKPIPSAGRRSHSRQQRMHRPPSSQVSRFLDETNATYADRTACRPKAACAFIALAGERARAVPKHSVPRG